MSNDAFRTELAELRDTVYAGFARMDRYFELQQAQHLELRGEVKELGGEVRELRGEVRELRGEVPELRGEVQGLRRLLVALTLRVDGIEQTVGRLEHEVRALRDWADRELADVRRELRLLRHAADDRGASLRRDMEALDDRVTRLEQRWDESRA